MRRTRTCQDCTAARSAVLVFSATVEFRLLTEFNSSRKRRIKEKGSVGGSREATRDTIFYVAGSLCHIHSNRYNIQDGLIPCGHRHQKHNVCPWIHVMHRCFRNIDVSIWWITVLSFWRENGVSS